MKTVTLSLEDDIYRTVEAEAAKRQTTVSSLAQEALRDLVAGRQPAQLAEQAEREQRLRLVDLLEQCQIDLEERPTREATYAHRRFH